MSACIRTAARALAPFAAVVGLFALAHAQDAARAPVNPPLPEITSDHAHALRLPDASLPAAAVKALLLPSWAGGSAPAWQALNTQWPQFGPTQVAIDTTSLGGASSFTYAQLVASGADVLVLSNPGGGNVQYSQAMVQAVARYAHDGHDLIGTYRVFQWYNTYNNALAPLFGLQDTPRYWPGLTGISNQFNVLQASPLLSGLGPTGWHSLGYPSTQTPQAGSRWGPAAGLAGAVPLAECDGLKAIVSLYETGSYNAIYVSNMPDYTTGMDDLQLLYNALTYSAP